MSGQLNPLDLITLKRLLPMYAAAPRGAAGFQKIVFSFNLCALFFQTATKLLRRIVTELFGPNYLINRRF